MSTKFKKRLVDLIEREGFRNAANTLGMSLTEVVHLSELKFGAPVAGSIIYELARENKIPLEYKEYKLYATDDGLIAWSTKDNKKYFGYDVKERITVYATPFWENQKSIPVELLHFEISSLRDEGIMNLDIYDSKDIKVSHDFYSIEDLLSWYRDVYLKNVYILIDELKQNCLKENQNKIKSRLDNFFHPPFQT